MPSEDAKITTTEIAALTQLAKLRRLRDGMHETKESLGSSFWGTRTSKMSLDDDYDDDDDDDDDDMTTRLLPQPAMFLTCIQKMSG